MTSKEFENLKINDIIVCINNYGEMSNLQIGEKYIVDAISPYLDLICVKYGKDGDFKQFVYDRFITLKEYEFNHRIDKIKKLL
jgi:hypothetical protein